MNFYDKNGLVICQECGKSYNLITFKHLNKYHNMTTQEYQKLHPNAPIYRIGFYDFVKKSKRKPYKTIDPIVEELEINLDENENFKSDMSVIKLTERKLPIPKLNSSDPMEDKIRIITYLKSSLFPNIINNYIFKKKKQDGTVEYQFITDIADPSSKIIFDFPNAFWHNKQIGLQDNVRNQILKSIGWKIIEVKSSMPKVLDVKSELKINKLY